MFYDSNYIQLSTETKEVTSENTAMKYEAWGWNVITINGNDADEIRAALIKANEEKRRPTLIIGKTIMGKGALDSSGNSFERKTSTHGMPLGEAGASFEKTIANLGGDPQNPFVVFPETAAYYSEVLKKKAEAAKAKKEEEKRWAGANSQLAAKLEQFFSGAAPVIDYSQIPQKDDSATRAASANVLFSKHTLSDRGLADLSNSDKTDISEDTKLFQRFCRASFRPVFQNLLWALFPTV
jgi:transketolase